MSQETSSGSEPCSSSAGSAGNLPPELVQAGWGQFWSKREGRYYYFNKLTNESRWELPTVGLKVSDFYSFLLSSFLLF